mmetsp:Transcript_84578/g.213299  ORF Transcript_84578/g.213299 Transcript_84578/m.213299 type:complete len:208 (+) Transcript_84578:77-700(+)
MACCTSTGGRIVSSSASVDAVHAELQQEEADRRTKTMLGSPEKPSKGHVQHNPSTLKALRRKLAMMKPRAFPRAYVRSSSSRQNHGLDTYEEFVALVFPQGLEAACAAQYYAKMSSRHVHENYGCVMEKDHIKFALGGVVSIAGTKVHVKWDRAVDYCDGSFGSPGTWKVVETPADGVLDTTTFRADCGYTIEAPESAWALLRQEQP